MKRMVSSCLSAALLFGVAGVGYAPHASAQTQERVIVTFKQTADTNVIEGAQGEVVKTFKQAPAVAAEVPSSAVAALEKNPKIASVEPDVKVKVSTQTQDWGIAVTNTPASWSSGYTGKGVKVAIVDTGISPHDDLHIAGGASFVSYTTSYGDDNGHGSHVAGIVAALNNDIGTVGVAPDSSLYAVKVLDNNGSGYLSDVIAGIDWAITNKVDVINLSLGSNTDSDALHAEIDKAYQNNILVVAAAGNDGTSDGSGDTVDYPAKYSSAIAVGAVDSANNRASFSSTGSEVEVSAPGVNILSTSNTNGYVRMSGTSMATPFVTGEVALLKQQNPTLSASELRALLDKNVKDLGSAGRDAWYGYGLVQGPVSAPAPTAPTPTSTPTQTAPTTTPTSTPTQTTTPATTPAPAPVPAPAPKPVPVVSKVTVTKVAPSKPTYVAGQHAFVNVRVTNQSSIALKGATVTLMLQDPKGRIVKGKSVTNGSGGTMFVVYTSRHSLRGIYKVTVSTTLYGYTASTGTTSFTLR